MTMPDTPASAAPTPTACQNCGTPLLGEHCYACGQPVKGLVRHFTSILGDFLDSVFNIDARVFRTLWPLWARPGYLSCEYFAGHRIRFVSPVRLFVFLSIVTFFVAQFTMDFGSDAVKFGNGDDDAIASATTVAQVEQQRDKAVAELEKAKAEAGNTPGVAPGLDVAANQIRAQAQRRIETLRKAEQSGKPVPKADDDESLSFNGRPWDAKTNPLHVSWLPGFANRWINVQVGHAKDNVKRMKQDPDLFKDAVLSAVPSTLFVLMPVFALMLKIAYAFRRRLYMEHLIVALHSHAFLCLSLLAIFLLTALQDVAAPGGSGALHGFLGLLKALLWTWMPVYLLLMQKRVYGQGWILTIVKYFTLGICYVVLLSFGALATMLASLVWM